MRQRAQKLMVALAALLLLLQVISPAACRAADFNLSSASKTAAAPADLARAVSLVVGGHTLRVTPGMSLTPAEQVALSQVLAGGKQTIVLNSLGAAVGGRLNVSKEIGSSMGSLVIPRGVIALDNAAMSPLLDVRGDLVNAGRLYAFSPTSAVHTALIQASAIENMQGGVISSILPSSLAASLAAVRGLGLSLRAGELTNYGTISSAGVLSIAAPTIKNISATGSAPALILAGTNMGLRADNIVNTGVISAVRGSIEVQTLAAKNLTLSGGDYLSKQLNLDASGGTLTANLHNVTGMVNVDAACAFLSADTPNLNLGRMNVTGDPTYFNTGGSLHVASISATNGADLALLAAGDVIVDGGSIDTWNTSASGGNGGNLTIVAGAKFTTSNNSQVLNDTATSVVMTQSALSTHGSNSGGAIDLHGVTGINTSGALGVNSTKADGGNVTLIAFDGSGGNGNGLTPGTINLGTSGFIATFGGLAGKNGDVTVIAGAASDPVGGSAITLPAIFSGNSPSNAQSGVSGGNVLIQNATPTLSSNITVLNGTPSGGTFGAGSTTAGSIKIGAVGGSFGALAELPNVVAWENAVAAYALDHINNVDRAGEGVSPLATNAAVTRAAQDYANYLAQTQHFSHWTLNGAAPWDRGQAEGVDLFAAGTYAENFGFEWGAGAGAVSAKTSFDTIDSGMMAEPNVPVTHHYNLTHHNFIGIGVASVGDSIYIVEDFTDNDVGNPTAPALPNAIHGGIGGGSGVVSNSSSNNTASAVGSASLLPTSINSGGSNSISLISGGSVTVDGFILANGASSALGQGPGLNGGNVSIQGTTVSLGGVQASGGLGGGSGFNGTSVQDPFPGGNGGTVNITAAVGNITITPPAPCSPCLAITAAGGAGGQTFDAGTKGGDGGNGGTINLSAPSGNISLTGIDAGGGGGSGGHGGGSGGAAGAGGKGGNGGAISISAPNGSIDVAYYLNASGGGGGGAGGATGSGLGGGGGGGASLGSAGFGGRGGINASFSAGGGGGGGALGALPGFGGDNVVDADTQKGANAFSGGNTVANTGGAAGLFGGGAGGGTGISGGGKGGDGGALGQAGANSGSTLGGAGGSGGSITLTANTVNVSNTVDGFWNPPYATASFPQAGTSILAIGAGGQVSITKGGSVQTLAPNADFSSNQKFQFAPVSSLAVGSGSASGIFGSISAGGTNDLAPITINQTQMASPIVTGNFSGPGSSGPYTILENGSSKVVNLATDQITPAELLAIIQVVQTGSQTITLNSSGVASGGTFTLTSSFIPANGLDTLVVPNGVTGFDSAPNLLVNSNLTVQAGATFQVDPGLTVRAGHLTVGGTYKNLSGDLNITGAPALTLSLLAGGTINAPAGNVVFGSTQTTTLVVTDTNGTGTITANGGNGNIIFNGGTNNQISVSAGSLSGTISGSGSSMQFSIASGTLKFGTIDAGAFSANSGSAAMTLNGDINVQNAVNLLTNNLTLADGVDINGGVIAITSQPATNLTITAGNGTGSSFAADVINFAAQDGITRPNLILSGELSFTGYTRLRGQTLNSMAATVVANDAVEVDAASIVLGKMPPLVIVSPNGAASIINQSGDVVLPSNLTFFGQNLAIIASGNISSKSTVTSINLSNTAGSGGSLTILAGVASTSLGADKYSIYGPSLTGGSVLLPKVAINTSTTLLTAANAGNVLIAAMRNSANTNAGSVFVGSIKASAPITNGRGGRVQILAPGGIQTGAIDTHGSIGGSVQLIAAAPAIVGGTFIIDKGTLAGDGVLIPGTPSANNGAALKVVGAINTSGAAGTAGKISLAADQRVQVTGAINATGFSAPSVPGATAGGSVSIQSLESTIATLGINVSGITISSTTSNARGGDAGNISLYGASGITVTGALIAKGADSKGTGGGGNGGTITLSTTNANATNGYYQGTIKVSSYIDARGGNASLLGGVGGAGGSVSSHSGVFIVSGSSGGNSINASAGTGGASTNGSVNLFTYAVQPLPTAFDLTSSTLSQVALPGGLFTVGIAGPVNGTAGNIIAGSLSIASKAKVNGGTGLIFNTSNYSSGNVAVTVTGGSMAIAEGTRTKLISAATSKGVRTHVTPSEAVALLQLSRNQTQITLNSLGQTISTSTIQIDETDLANSFSAFKLKTVDGTPAAVTLNITGLYPIVTLPTAAVLNGALNFITPSSVDVLNLQGGALNLQAGGSITAPNTALLILSGTGATWNNSGTISAGNIEIARPSSGLTFNLLGAAADITGPAGATIGLSPSIDASLTVTFIAKGANFSLPVIFNSVAVPTSLPSAYPKALKASSTLPSVVLKFELVDAASAPITASVGGTVTANAISISSLPLLFNGSNRLDSMIIGNAAHPAVFTSNTTIAISSCAGIDIGANSTLIANKGNLTAIAKSGNMVIGNTDSFTAIGGNIQVLASGTVSGGTGDSFNASVIGTATTAPGGGIEIGSGLITSTALSAALSGKPGTTTVPLNSAVPSNNNGNLQAFGLGTFNLNGSALTLNRGAIVFDAVSASSSVTFGGGSSFTTTANRPVSGAVAPSSDDIIIDTGDDAR